jgi:beta-N-acetylhexosaminidase
VRKAYLLLLAIFCLLVVGCVEDPEIIVSGADTVKEGETIVLDVEVTGSKKEVACESEDDSVLLAEMLDRNTCIVTGVAAGTAEIIFTVGDYSVTYRVTVEENEPDDEDEEDEEEEEDEEDDDDEALAFVNNVIESMTLEEKIGQMFIVGFVGSTIPQNTLNNISQYKFGNYIFMQYNTESKEDLFALTTALQDNILNLVGVPAFISIDQEGGKIVKFVSGATHFIGNMALAATGEAENALSVGKAVGEELRNFGINVDFAPVLDVNNNPKNPIIGVRSYSDSPEVVAAFGCNMIRGLKESRVMATAKHFPGHGDTDVDTHYGLPRIPHDMDRLYQVELYPYIEAIEAGLDAIMTTHIVFEKLDPDYPATLSRAVLTGLLREELRFEGLIVTDAMEMKAIVNHFGMAEAAILAVLAGADILTFTESTSNSVTAYNAVLDAVRSGRIGEERIDESVRRILLKKYEYGLFADCYPRADALWADLTSHRELNERLGEKSLTLAKGDFSGLDKSRRTLVISSRATRYALEPGLSGDANSFAYVARKHLSARGHDVDYYVFSTTKYESIIAAAPGYDQIIIAFENPSGNEVNLIREIYQINPDVVVVSLDKPYDINLFPEIENYICVYEYTPLSAATLIRYFDGEFTATGVLPVALE